MEDFVGKHIVSYPYGPLSVRDYLCHRDVVSLDFL